MPKALTLTPRLILPALLLLALPGCYINRDTVNPGFLTDNESASLEERRMRADPKPLERPVLIIGGYRSPDPFVESMAFTLARMTSGSRRDFVRRSTWLEHDIEQVAAEVVELLNDAYPSDVDGETIEVDVVGLSMGGLVSRYAADRLQHERPGARRLRINRLFTLATPHRGANLAERMPLIEDKAVLNMYRGSLFLTKLDEAYDADYEIIPFTRLEDGVVGAINTAPPGRTPIWVSAPIFGGSHTGIGDDRRILTEIARRLRGEEPQATEGTPLPDSEMSK